MAAALGWAFAVGVVFHLLGASAQFIQLAGGVLAIAFVFGLILVILNLQAPWQVVGPVIGAALALGFIPSYIAGLLKTAWDQTPASVIFFLAIILLGVAFYLSRNGH